MTSPTDAELRSIAVKARDTGWGGELAGVATPEVIIDLIDRLAQYPVADLEP